MTRLATIVILVLAAPSVVSAHVTVRPRESKPGIEERYTVTVPTEGSVATTHVRLEIPREVTVLEVLPAEGATVETSTNGDRVAAITWRKVIPPKAAAEFVFRARNPASGDIVWKAHQEFADGTAADWVGLAGERRPASVTRLLAGGNAEAPAPKSSGLSIARRHTVTAEGSVIMAEIRRPSVRIGLPQAERSLCTTCVELLLHGVTP